MHTELTESGQELPRLRDYFSNPGNFEKQAHVKPELSHGLARTSSVQTFDSLDFARYSDDGEKQVDERVAVLEFELRKAKDTIKSLRANLTTVAADSEASTPDTNAEQLFLDDTIKPHEQRALNFLVNEYLLKYEYKLTSITFSDENEEQDFEDWDDVGLNIPKPPDLVSLYREFIRHVHPYFRSQSTGVQTHLENDMVIERRLYQSELVDEINLLKENSKTLTKEKEKLEGQLKQLIDTKVGVTQVPRNIIMEENYSQEELSSLFFLKKDDRPLDSISLQMHVSTDPPEKHLLTDQVASFDFNTDYASKKQSDTSAKSGETHRKDNTLRSVRKYASDEFHKTVMDICCIRKCLPDNRLAVEVEKITETDDAVIEILGRCLPYIVPNVILAKREELIPVLLCAIKLHPSSKERDNLLNILFNLIKKPDCDQRTMILNGFASIARQIGPSRIEDELLPQCWEQISHKYIERRLLVAESCGVLAPYVPAEIRSSLLLSMLQQMLQDKSEVVREAVVKSLTTVFLFIVNEDKFTQGCELLSSLMMDESEHVLKAATNIFLPVLASWAIELDKLENGLTSMMVGQLEELIKNINTDDTSSLTGNDERVIVAYGTALSSLMPWLFLSMLQTGPFMENVSRYLIQNGKAKSQDFIKVDSPLEDLNIITGDQSYVMDLISAYEIFTSEEWFESWDKFDWISKTLLPQLITICYNTPILFDQAVIAFARLFHRLCVTFRGSFVSLNLKPHFCSLSPSTSGGTKNAVLTTSLVPIYVIGVLATFFKEEDQNEFVSFLKELLVTLCLDRVPLCTLRLLIAELCCDPVLYELLTTVLWSGVVHSSSKVRCGAARLFELLVSNGSDIILGTKITPALVTLASDGDIAVRIATIPAFGAIMKITTQKELLDKVRLQFQTFLEDPQYDDDDHMVIELVRTFGQISPSVDSCFREECK